MMRSLLYVSRKAFSREEEIEAIQSIGRVSQSRNLALDVTGALMSAGSYFAQRLEGTDAAIDELMTSILRDPRHRDARIVDDHLAMQREFRGWRIAYSGPSSFIARRIAALLDVHVPLIADIRSLSRVIRDFGD